jgi:hypothetical protein
MGLKVEDLDKTKKTVKKTPKKKSVETPPDGYFLIEGMPSKGKLYPKGTKIYSRPLKILEVKQLSSMTEFNFNMVINSVLKKTVKGIDIADLLVTDKLFIIFWQRANTYKGDFFSVDFECERCSTTAKYDFEIGNLQLDDLSDDYDPDKIIEVPDSKKKINLNQLTVKDERLVDNFLEANSDDYDVDMLTIASIINTIDEKDMSLKDKYDMLIDLSVLDNLIIDKEYRTHEISVKPTMIVTCKNCGGKAETPITFRPDFFLPEYSV